MHLQFVVTVHKTFVKSDSVLKNQDPSEKWLNEFDEKIWNNIWYSVFQRRF